MIRTAVQITIMYASWPRTSGDDPFTISAKVSRTLLAPHERG